MLLLADQSVDSTDDECGGAEDENNILDATLTCVVHQIVLVGLGSQHYPAKPAGQVGRKRHKNVLRSNPGPTLHASRRIETILSITQDLTRCMLWGVCKSALRMRRIIS